MRNIKELKEFRAEEIAKLTLLKSSYKLGIEGFPASLFDFFVQVEKQPEIKFAVAVKGADDFLKHIAQHKERIRIYQDTGLLNIPVLLMKINEAKETGEIDFLVEPLPSGELQIKKGFNFQKMNPENLDKLINRIIIWKKENNSNRHHL